MYSSFRSFFSVSMAVSGMSVSSSAFRRDSGFQPPVAGVGGGLDCAAYCGKGASRLPRVPAGLEMAARFRPVSGRSGASARLGGVLFLLGNDALSLVRPSGATALGTALFEILFMLDTVAQERAIKPTRRGLENRSRRKRLPDDEAASGASEYRSAFCAVYRISFPPPDGWGETACEQA
ncbi:exported protein of unknown function (plasmid) [Ralstonia solanacearum PSI07]|nr:exported protein of unknown function [Ralstonia solanacearum PSI07]